MKYIYKDFITKKERFTRGAFLHWQRGGILKTWGAVFQTKRGFLFIPRYLLSKETLSILPPLPTTLYDRN